MQPARSLRLAPLQSFSTPLSQSVPPPMTSPPTMDHSSSNKLRCLWDTCSHESPDGEALYVHLCNEHIGRKSTNNLCLTCRWKDCNTTCAKRDHITSHLRVHTPLKPHTCDVCSKTFKRPQDLKKHEKIHTEEHHQQHRHSKAITVLDPAYSSRVRGTAPSEPPATYLTVDEARAAVAAGIHPVRNGSRPNGKSSSSTPSTTDEALTPGSNHRGPTPPHLVASAEFPPTYGHPSLPSWEFLRSDHLPGKGGKRTHDSLGTNVLDEFFHDIKKRKYDSTYDADMAERLTALSTAAFAHRLASVRRDSTVPPSTSNHLHQRITTENINPSLPPPGHASLQIPSLRSSSQSTGSSPALSHAAALTLASIPPQALPGSPEELAIVNNFLVRLGEEIAAGHVNNAAMGAAHHQQTMHNTLGNGGHHGHSLPGFEGLMSGLSSNPPSNMSNAYGLPQQSPNHRHRDSSSNGQSADFYDAALSQLGLGSAFGTSTSSPSQGNAVNSFANMGSSLYSDSNVLASLQPQRPPTHSSSASADLAGILNAFDYGFSTQQYDSDKRGSQITSATGNKTDGPAGYSPSSVSKRDDGHDTDHAETNAEHPAPTLSSLLATQNSKVVSPNMTMTAESAGSDSSPSASSHHSPRSADGGSPGYTGAANDLEALLRPRSAASSNGSGPARAPNHGYLHVPTISPMESLSGITGGVVRNSVVRLKSAPSVPADEDVDGDALVKIEEEDGDLDDDERMSTQSETDSTPTPPSPSTRSGTMSPQSHPTHFPSRTLPPLVSYSLPAASSSWPSIASVVSASSSKPVPIADIHDTSLQRVLPPIRSASEETEDDDEPMSSTATTRRRLQLLSLSPPHSTSPSGSKMGGSLYPRLNSVLEAQGTALPSIAALKLPTSQPSVASTHIRRVSSGMPDAQAELDRERRERMRSGPASPVDDDSDEEDEDEEEVEQKRQQHVELIRQLLVWVNEEYVRVHGDPWDHAEKLRKQSESVVARDVEMVA